MEKSKCRAWLHNDYKLFFPSGLSELELLLFCEFLSWLYIIYKASLFNRFDNVLILFGL